MPLITGHEMTGTVIERGSNIKNIELGSRVAVNTVLKCSDFETISLILS